MNDSITNEIKRRPRDADSDVVLCHLTKAATPWVTWVVDADGNRYWGHYFDAFNNAVTDFNNR